MQEKRYKANKQVMRNSELLTICSETKPTGFWLSRKGLVDDEATDVKHYRKKLANNAANSLY